MASGEAGNRSPVSNLVPVYAAEFTTTTDLSVYGLDNDLEDVYSLGRALSSYILNLPASLSLQHYSLAPLHGPEIGAPDVVLIRASNDVTE